MGVNKYSHSFTKVQLELIIDDYLGLGPYYQILHKQMKDYIRKIQSQQQTIHNSEKVHPIRIYTKDYLSKNFQDGDATQLHLAFESLKCDIRTTYSSVVAKFYYIYPLEVIVEILESQSFYKSLPKNIIINQLLTTQNIQIIIVTLTIISEEMSKKIKTTLSSKDVKRAQVLYKEKIDQKKDEEDFFQAELPAIREEDDERTTPQSKIDIFHQNLFEEEEEQAVRKGQKKRTFNPLVRTEMPNYLHEPKLCEIEKSCVFCQNYLLYLTEANGQSYGDDCLNKLSKESIRCLKVIAKTVTYFTLYLLENNLTQIPNDIHILNRVLNTIGIVITEDIFNSELNPKNKKPTQITSLSKPKNLIQHLVPYFNSTSQKHKEKSKDFYTIDELFRMVIYCPTVEQVSQQLKNYQAELFQRQNSVLKNCENEQKVKTLLRKEYNYIRKYQGERLQISKNTINTKPIYKQLQFEEEKVPPPSTQPQNYNVNSCAPTSRIKSSNSSKYPFMEKNQTMGPTIEATPTHNLKKENKSLMLELSNSISHNLKFESSQEQSESTTIKTDKMKFKKQSDKNDKQFAMSCNLKKNIIKNQGSSQGKPAPQVQQLSICLLKPPILEKQVENQLSEGEFRKLLYHAFAKSNGLSRSQQNLTVPNVQPASYTAPNFNSFLGSSNNRSNTKKNNGYSSSLTQFIGRKQEEEQIECMQKLQKQTYNRQLLNGQFVRNQIYEELKLGTVKVYDNYANACGLIDSLRFEQISTTYDNLNLAEDGLLKPTSDSASSRRKLQRSGSRKHYSNVIEENSTKYNQSGLIRNEKYNKSIKSELINHRQSYLRNIQNENLSRMHLAQTSKLKKVSSKQGTKTIKQQYNQQLKRRLANRTSGQDQGAFSEFREL